MRAVHGLIMAVTLSLPCGAQACRLALALGLDVSASVDGREYRLQMQGTAAALTSPEVQAALLGGRGPVALAAYQWAGRREHWRLTDWVVINSAADVQGFAAVIAAAKPPPFNGRTATGEAMRAGLSLLAEAPDCDRHTLDLSTDGLFNDGVDPRTVVASDITINALAIGGDVPTFDGFGNGPTISLAPWLEKSVIRGQGAFVQRAADFADIERAMTRKLLRELGEALLGQAGPAKAPAG